MKLNYILTLFFLLNVFNKIPLFFKDITLIGEIVYNTDSKDYPKFKILYNGYEFTTDKYGFYTIKIDKNIKKLNLLITKDIVINKEKFNTVNGFKLKSNSNYKFYSFNLSFAKDKWFIDNSCNLEVDSIIPSDFIIILMDPDLVSKVTISNLKNSNNILHLPKIVLKDKIDFSLLDDEAVKSLISSLDKSSFHERIICKNKCIDGNCVVQIVAQ